MFGWWWSPSRNFLPFTLTTLLPSIVHHVARCYYKGTKDTNTQLTDSNSTLRHLIPPPNPSHRPQHRLDPQPMSSNGKKTVKQRLGSEASEVKDAAKEVYHYTRKKNWLKSIKDSVVNYPCEFESRERAVPPMIACSCVAVVWIAGWWVGGLVLIAIAIVLSIEKNKIVAAFDPQCVLLSYRLARRYWQRDSQRAPLTFVPPMQQARHCQFPCFLGLSYHHTHYRFLSALGEPCSELLCWPTGLPLFGFLSPLAWMALIHVNYCPSLVMR